MSSSSWDYPDDEPAAGSSGGDRLQQHQVVVVDGSTGVSIRESIEFTTTASGASSTTSSNTGAAATAASGSGGGSGWFGNLMTTDLNFRNVAHCLTDAVHRTAVAVAHEIAMLEERMDEEGEDGGDKTGTKKTTTTITTSKKAMKTTDDDDYYDDDGDYNYHQGSLVLPWEVNVKSASKSSSSPLSTSTSNPPVPVYVTDNALMKEILALSLMESTFREPLVVEDTGTKSRGIAVKNEAPTISSKKESLFVLDEPRLQLIRRLLDIDPNLASMHARLSTGEKKEEEIGFWKNYFLNCDRVRQRHGVSQQTTPTRNRGRGKNLSNNRCQPSIDDDGSNDDMIETVMASKGVRHKLDRMVSSLAEDGNETNNSHVDYDDEDDESLIPASSGDEEEDNNDYGNGDDLDDSSYVIASAPTSANTFASTRSMDDVVFVNKDNGRSDRR